VKILFLGETGPLVYPAFHVYFYTLFYFVTSRGSNIRLAQFLFIGIYLVTLWLVLRLFTKSRKIPPYVVVLSVFTSYRIHSIYSLRLFNDPIAMMLLFGALNLFMDRRWNLGSFVFSLAVGTKMNILLFAPAILMLYITSLGFVQTIVQLAICGFTQLIIGAPFLLTHPISYFLGAFNFGRIFEHKWTVNYRFLSKEFFESKPFHLSLLAVHLLLLVVIAKPCYIFFKNYARLRTLQKQFQPQLEAENREIEEAVRRKMKRMKQKVEEEEEMTEEQKKFLKAFEKGMKDQYGAPTAPPAPAEEEDPQKVEIHFDQCVQLALLPIFLTNFIGVICARSLHYQFYVWYFHTLPYLSWFTDFHTSFKILILFLIEFCWNQYPSTIFSSILLHVCHAALLVGVVRKIYRETRLAREAVNAANDQKSK
jgi:alpha-1,3-mannosyltransferase